jgi:hypothetical protein
MLRVRRPRPVGAFVSIYTISPNAYRGHPATCGTRQEDFREHAGSDHIILPGGTFLSQSHPKSRPSRFFWSILDPHLSDPREQVFGLQSQASDPSAYYGRDLT